jgi:hypothetical protein
VSGRRWCEGPDAEYPIDGEGEYAEHKMAFDLDRAAHAGIAGKCGNFVKK